MAYVDRPFTGDIARVGVPDADIPLTGVEVLAGWLLSFKNASLFGEVALNCEVGDAEDLRSIGLEYNGSLLFRLSNPDSLSSFPDFPYKVVVCFSPV